MSSGGGGASVAAGRTRARVAVSVLLRWALTERSRREESRASYKALQGGSTEEMAAEGAAAIPAIPAKRHLSGSYSNLSEDEAGNEDASMGHTEDNEDDFETVNRRKKKTKRSSQHSQGKVHLSESSRTVLVVPTEAEMNLRKLNWQLLSDELETMAPKLIKEIRVNLKKNIIAIEARTEAAVLDLLITNKICGIPVRAFLPRAKHTRAGVIGDVDTTVTMEKIVELIDCGVHVVYARRFGVSRSVKVVFEGDTLPAHVKIGLVRYSKGGATDPKDASTAKNHTPQRQLVCPKLQEEKKICSVKASQNLTFQEAAKQVHEGRKKAQGDRRGNEKSMGKQVQQGSPDAGETTKETRPEQRNTNRGSPEPNSSGTQGRPGGERDYSRATQGRWESRQGTPSSQAPSIPDFMLMALKGVREFLNRLPQKWAKQIVYVIDKAEEMIRLFAFS
ncbi:hypothetical protein HPB47_001621 [Ixodes persulcatus]|uniref:Uncharacterized protein n=1 Tax=Ixodes persulcatus TaxID=34615 RepID=A0AC60PPP6_IXOPE|nr:hypothetical protein HPB47_001621 [Ixodes persulcatus]